jgi:hypothetical protein
MSDEDQLFEDLRGHYQAAREKANIEMERVLDQIEAARKGAGQFPTVAEIQSVNELQEEALRLANILFDYRMERRQI